MPAATRSPCDAASGSSMPDRVVATGGASGAAAGIVSVPAAARSSVSPAHAAPKAMMPNAMRLCLRSMAPPVHGESGARDGRPDTLELPPVHKIVAGVELHHVLEAFLAPLGMEANALPVARRGALEELEVRFTERREPPERRVDAPARVRRTRVQSLDPRILIIAGEGRPVLG